MHVSPVVLDLLSKPLPHVRLLGRTRNHVPNGRAGERIENDDARAKAKPHRDALQDALLVTSHRVARPQTHRANERKEQGS